jgi:hypothetical protein
VLEPPAPGHTQLVGTPRDWDLYAERCRDAHVEWLRGLTVEQSVALFAEMFEDALSRPPDPAERERLDRIRWEEKLAVRLRLVRAFQALDRLGWEPGGDDARPEPDPGRPEGLP